MSPEGYIEHSYGPKTDVWAFGLVIYELLHGKAPLAHIGSQDELKRQLRVQMKGDSFRADLSSELKELMLRCLEVDEKKRISMPEIEGLNYFQSNITSKFMSEIKVNTMKFRRLSVPNNVPFTRTSVKNIVDRKMNKENPKFETKFLTSKELPSGKRMEKVPSDEIE